MRLVILCEGDTEEAILSDFLKPLCSKFEGIRVINAKGAGRLAGEFKEIAEREIKSNENTIVFCLIDLYKAPFNYPKEITESATPYKAQYIYIKRYMEEAIIQELRGRFFAFPVVMEIETWILADIDALNQYFKPPHKQRLKAFASPETIQQPAVELKNIWKRFRLKNSGYDKKLHGKRLFRHVEAQRIYDDNCPHFEAMVNQLFELQGLSVSKVDKSYNTIAPKMEFYNQLKILQERHDDIVALVVSSDIVDENLYEEAKQIEIEIQLLNEKVKQLHSS